MEAGRRTKGGRNSWGERAHLSGSSGGSPGDSTVAPFPFSSRTTLLVELSWEGRRSLGYLPGEHLGVFPSNQPALVQGILERVVDGPAPHQPVCLETLSETGEPSTLTLHTNARQLGLGLRCPQLTPSLLRGGWAAQV